MFIDRAKCERMTEAEMLALLDHMRTEIAAYKGNLGSFAYSIDTLDTWHAEAVRDDAKRLALAVAARDDDDLAQRAFLALSWICVGDEYCEKEVAPPFRRFVARLRLAAWIRRHPRADRFGSLAETVERGKHTKKQHELAKKIAGEAMEIAARKAA